MKFFKDENKQVWAFEEDGSQDDFIGENLTPIIEEEADLIRNPVLSSEQLLEQAAETVRIALNKAIDEIAHSLGFKDGANGLKSFAGYPNAYRDLAEQFGAWEAGIWEQSNSYKAEVIAGEEPMLTPEEAVAMMPELVIN